MPKKPKPRIMRKGWKLKYCQLRDGVVPLPGLKLKPSCLLPSLPTHLELRVKRSGKTCAVRCRRKGYIPGVWNQTKATIGSERARRNVIDRMMKFVIVSLVAQDCPDSGDSVSQSSPIGNCNEPGESGDTRIEL